MTRIHILPRTFSGQMILLMLVTLVITQVVSVGIYLRDRREAIGEANIYGMLHRIGAVARLLEQADESDFPMIQRAVSGTDMHLKVQPSPLLETLPAKDSWAGKTAARLAKRIGRTADDVRVALVSLPSEKERINNREDAPPSRPRPRPRHHPKHSGPPQWASHQLLISVEIRPDIWLNASSWTERQAPSFAWRSTQSLLPVGLLVLGLMIFLIRRATKPLERLADAASRFGRGLESEPIAAAGPAELQQTIKAYNDMQDRLARFISDRTLMLAAISHDLRTPLTSLRLRAEFVTDPELRERMLETLEQMEQMIRSTLDFARNEAQQEPARKLDFSSLIESLCDDLADIGQPVTVRVPERTIIECKPVAIKRALNNLITNAVKYGGNARVKLERGHGQLTVIIDDDGPGIAEEQLEKVFTPFFRLDTARSSDGSVGLGLSLARTIIHSHGGEVTLRNRPEGGLRVSVTIPT